MTLMAESVTPMQGASTTLIQNHIATQTAPDPLTLPSGMFSSHGLTHMLPNNPVSIPPLFTRQLLHGVVLGSTLPLQMPAAVTPTFCPIFISTPPSVPLTMANPMPIIIPYPLQIETFIQSPRTCNVAFVGELLQENLCDSLETRLETRIASLQTTKG